MSPIVGIDLGTTYSAVAIMGDEGPALIKNAIGEVLTPSVVGFDKDGFLFVGQTAKDLQVTNPDSCASLFKRHMGSDWTISLNRKTYSAEQLSSLVLRALKQDAEAFLGESVDRAVITVPAYFNELQRKATMRAGELAGLKVERIINEPTAAAIAYGWHSTDEEKTIVILDLGGGTFDVSVVEIFQGTLEVKASSGETFLGGVDFTNAIAARVLERQGLRFETTEMRHPKMMSRLLQECEQAKRQLSRQDEVVIRVPTESGEYTESTTSVTIRREEFEKWTESILGRIEIPIRRALGDASVRREQIHELILAGGATRMPLFIQHARRLLSCEPTCRLNPDEVVAMGAAVQAALFARSASVEDLVVTDVSPYTLGIDIVREVAGEHLTGYFLPIINRNTALPVSRVERVTTVLANQAEIQVRVYQGESRKVEGNLLLGEFQVTGVPRGPAGKAVDIRFTYDLNGILEVEATVVETQIQTKKVITRHAKGLSPAQVSQAVAEMAALKSHPRDEMENRHLLIKAERLYQELPFQARRILDQLISGFEEAIELQDPSAIESNRHALTEFVNQFDYMDPDQETYDDGGPDSR